MKYRYFIVRVHTINKVQDYPQYGCYRLEIGRLHQDHLLVLATHEQYQRLVRCFNGHTYASQRNKVYMCLEHTKPIPTLVGSGRNAHGLDILRANYLTGEPS